MNPHITIVLGPTASGKTDYGITLAQKCDGAIISADSRQVYSDMNIGTAKPEDAWSSISHDIMTPDSVQNIDHYLFNIAGPDNPITLPDWQGFAYDVIENLLDSGRVPIIVGGTMLYIDSLVYNYDIPNVDSNKELRSKLESESRESLYGKLLAMDPDATSFIEPHNTRRIIRALEVMQATGKPFSDQRKRRVSKYDWELIGLFPEWDVLKKRIFLRAQGMVKGGLVEETRHLQDIYGSTLPLLSTMGYAQCAEIISGTLIEDAAIEEIARVTMRYARRQMSWWRGREDITWVS